MSIRPELFWRLHASLDFADGPELGESCNGSLNSVQQSTDQQNIRNKNHPEMLLLQIRILYENIFKNSDLNT